MFDLDDALREVIKLEGSDLHLKVPSKPLARVHGVLQPLAGTVPLTPPDTERLLGEMLTDATKLAEFEREGEVDFAYAVHDLARFRVNAFRQRGSVSIVARAIPYRVRTIEELALPSVITQVAEEERGLILLTGTTGSGKSTTLAAIIDHINRTKPRHVVTIEDPIEALHRDDKAIINQREVGSDTESFNRAMRRVLRQDPDVILIGEMRDEETVRSALAAAETGHLVLSTVHSMDAPETVNRVIDFFEPHEHNQVRAMLAGTMKAIISQRLIPTMDGNGRLAVCEILRHTARARDMILDPEQTGRLREVITEGAYYGMQTFDQALLRHYFDGLVTMEDALRIASSPHDFKLMVAARGRTSTSMEDLSSEPSPDGQDAAAAPAGPQISAPPERPAPEPVGVVDASAFDASASRPVLAAPRQRLHLASVREALR